jgi:hypothetical protein
MLLKQDSDYIMFLRGCQPLVFVLSCFTVPRVFLGGRLTFAAGSKFSIPGFSDSHSEDVAHLCPHSLLRMDETRKQLFTKSALSE